MNSLLSFCSRYGRAPGIQTLCNPNLLAIPRAILEGVSLFIRNSASATQYQSDNTSIRIAAEARLAITHITTEDGFHCAGIIFKWLLFGLLPIDAATVGA